MPATIIKFDAKRTYDADARAAADRLRAGGLVIFPTETVYGLAAAASQPVALAKVRTLKVRDGGRPFTVHLAEPREARRFMTAPSPVAMRLMRRGWPGPLTLVYAEPDPPKTDAARDQQGAPIGEMFYEGMIGLRCPDHALTQAILARANTPVVATSVNRSGAPPAVDVSDGAPDFAADVDFIFDAGRTRFAGPSTIVEVRGNAWKVIRAGVLEERIIRRMVRTQVLFVCTGNTCRSPLAEYLFRHKLAQALGLSVSDLESAGYDVLSAGSFAGAGSPASEGTLGELAQRGIDASRHRSQSLSTELIQRSDFVFAMTPDHLNAVMSRAPGAAARVRLLDDEAVSDPMGGPPEAYGRAAKQIEAAVARRVEEVLHEDRDW